MDKKSQAQTKVRVIVRVRPSLSDEDKCLSVDGKSIHLVNHRNTDESLQYEFASVFGQTSTQEEIFSDCVEPLIHKTLQGQNVSIFAYGPTGAGKTHTMLGPQSDPGIIPRVIQTVFRLVDQDEEAVSTKVSFSYLEIYQEKVHDLLTFSHTDLPIREDASHNIFVSGITEKTIDSFETFLTHFEPAASNRTVAATKLNAYSSRSHSILVLKILKRMKGKVYSGKIYLIDLAGSEDNRRTGNKGIRLKESGAINKSLFVLGEVVDAINNNLIRVPYRNSKLTRLLQDSIGGSCHSVMITNIAPERRFYYDTYCTLNFATKSRKIVNVNVVNVKENRPPSFEKPTATVKPVKRRSSTAQRESKRRRFSADASSLDMDKSSMTCATPHLDLPPSLPSPLVRQQRAFESAMTEKIRVLEEKLAEKWRDSVSKTNDETVSIKMEKSASTPSLSEQKRNKCLRMSYVSVSSNDSPDIVCPTPQVLKTTASKLSNDTSNLLAQRHFKKAEGKPNRLKLKRVQDDGPSISPLFCDSLAKKNSKSRRSSDSDSPALKKAKEAAGKFQNEDQFQRNSDFLEILNTANEKELQKLQTVGIKRAQLIFQWREMHGKFKAVHDLKEIPGFTSKYFTNLLRSNLITGQS